MTVSTALRPVAGLLLRPLAALALVLAMLAPPTSAAALTPDEARGFVEETVAEVLALVRSDASPGQQADRFQAIMERRGAMPQIARFAAGRLWREMSPSQQSAYTDAFANWLSVTYSRRFSDYSGQDVTVTDTRDLGDRGVEVVSRVSGGGQAPAQVVWVISDRPGRTVLADLKIEGVSMLITQREEVAAIAAREGGVDGLIETLNAAERTS